MQEGNQKDFGDQCPPYVSSQTLKWFGPRRSAYLSLLLMFFARLESYQYTFSAVLHPVRYVPLGLFLCEEVSQSGLVVDLPPVLFLPVIHLSSVASGQSGNVNHPIHLECFPEESEGEGVVPRGSVPLGVLPFRRRA